MTLKKTLCLLLLPLFFSFSVFSQSLVEVAKKERERRESLRVRKRIVITNADLAKLKKKPALIIPPPPVTEMEAESEIPEEKTAETESSPDMALRNRQAQDLQVTAQKKSEETKVELEEKWRKATEYRELLELKMNALWQEFYSMDDMTPRDQIQKTISETFLKLQAAQEAEAKAKEELDNFSAQAQRERASSIWIK